MPRLVQPELLDSLAPDDPAAQRFRRDMRLTNAAMGNHRWIARTLPGLMHAAEIALELGAGTGELASRLRAQGVAVDGLDLWPAPPGWPEARTWHRADVLTFSGYEAYPVFVGNMILHQFADAELAALGAKLRASARVIVACEPARRPLSRVLYRVIAPLFGASRVALHDGDVSIVAGFRGDELPRLLGLERATWEVRVSQALLGACHLVAVHRS
jgi:SAM-dependent methyltransferase